jgi:hypothetical protein
VYHPDDDATGDDETITAAVAEDGSTVVTGEFLNTLLLDEGRPTEQQLQALGYRDLFVARYTP